MPEFYEGLESEDVRALLKRWTGRLAILLTQDAKKEEIASLLAHMTMLSSKIKDDPR